MYLCYYFLVFCATSIFQTRPKQNTLFAVAYILSHEKGFHRALTYNFDPLVQECLIEIFNVTPNQILTHPRKWSSFLEYQNKDSIEIFHVHGYIPRNKNKEKEPFKTVFPKETSQIILSEDSYYNTERYGAYNWQNSIQSYYLNRDSCVFVGFSGEDYNFRRILRQMGDTRNNGLEHLPHYLIVAIDDIIRDTWKNVCYTFLTGETKLDKIQETTILLVKEQLKIKTKYWARYGFFPIWLTISEIASFLVSLVSD